MDRPTDPQTADNFAAAIESAAEDVPRRNGSAPTARQAPPAPAAAVTWEPLRPRSLTPVQLTAATGATRARKSTPAKLAAPPVTAAPSKAVAPDDDDEGGEEPIQTRSMARLLAMQGHRRRALAIYEALLRADAADASLRAEADALRQSG